MIGQPVSVVRRPDMTRRSFGAAAFAASMFAAARTGRAAEPIRIGAVLPLTGPVAQTGIQEQRGIQFAVTKLNAAGGIGGRPVEILYEDNQAKPDLAVLAFNKLTDLSKVPVVFSGFSGPTLAMAPLATRKKVLLVNGAAQADRLAKASPYLVNTLPVVADEAAVLAKHLFEDGKKRAAVLFENDAGGTAGRDDFVESYTKLGGTILGQEQGSFSQTDYRPALLKLIDLQPEVLFVMLTDGLPSLAEQVGQLKPKFLIAGTSFFSDPHLLKSTGAEGWIHTQLRVKAPESLAAEFRKETSSEMDFFASQYFNAASIVFRTVRTIVEANQTLSGAAIREKLFEIRDFNELIPTSFKTNTASMEIDIVRISGGKDEFVKSYASQ